LEKDVGDPDILLHLMDQSFRVGEPFLSPEPSKKAEDDPPAIQRAFEIEDMDLDLKAAGPEGGTVADIGQGRMGTPANIGHGDVDAPGKDLIERLDVGCRKTQPPSATRAADNAARDLIGAA